MEVPVFQEKPRARTNKYPPAPPGDIYLCPREAPAGAEDGLSHFVAYCRKIWDFKPEISLSFPIAKTIGGGGIIKNGIDEMSD